MTDFTAILEKHRIGSCCSDEKAPTLTGADSRSPSEIVLSNPGCSNDDWERANWNISVSMYSWNTSLPATMASYEKNCLQSNAPSPKP
jgi:hypothetical protein